MKVLVIAPGGSVARGASDATTEIDAETLANELRALRAAISSALEAPAPVNPSGFKLKEISIAATLTAGGKLAILGFGADVRTSGTISLCFSSS